MKITVSREAAAHLKKELVLADGEGVRFHTRVYGKSVHPGFSLGINKDQPRYLSHHTYSEGVLFFFEQQDDWFLEGYRMEVVLTQGEDIDYIFTPEV